MLALVGIVLLALSLRTAVASLSPLYGLIARDFALPAVVIGLITTAPPVCYGLFGIITPRLENRFGLERLAVAALAAVAAGLGMRALVMDAVGMLAATTLVFAGIGVGNILMPPLVKKYFPDRLGMMTALYSTTLAVSTFVPPLVAVPVAEAAGWRWSLGLWAVFSVLALIPWVTLLVRARGDGGVEVETSAPGCWAGSSDCRSRGR